MSGCVVNNSYKLFLKALFKYQDCLMFIKFVLVWYMIRLLKYFMTSLHCGVFFVICKVWHTLYCPYTPFVTWMKTSVHNVQKILFQTWLWSDSWSLLWQNRAYQICFTFVFGVECVAFVSVSELGHSWVCAMCGKFVMWLQPEYIMTSWAQLPSTQPQQVVGLSGVGSQSGQCSLYQP